MKHIFIILMLFWDKVEFTLTEKECRELPTFERGFVSDEYKKAEYQRGDVIYFSCDPGYTTGLNASYICTEHGWRAATYGQCIGDTFPVRLGCAHPPPLKNGYHFYTDGEKVRFKCDRLYELKGGLHKTCSNGRWTRDFQCVVSVPLACGKPRVELSSVQRIIGGSAAPQGSIPWQVRLSGDGAGMLIADRWVLTAAHILTPNMQPRALNSVKIFWGKNTRDDSQVPNAIAASVHLHPGYNNSENLNFDNDIALIKLPEPVTFNKFVMPICLPSEENTLQDGIMGVVSGFGLQQHENGNYFRSNDLQYVRLPVVNPSHCSESLSKLKNSTSAPIPKESHNMFCAGFPEGGKGSCQGDSGGPFALWSRDHYWAAGIASWGIDCAREGTYDFYTKVSNYVDWIHKTMKEN